MNPDRPALRDLDQARTRMKQAEARLNEVYRDPFATMSDLEDAIDLHALTCRDYYAVKHRYRQGG